MIQAFQGCHPQTALCRHLNLLLIDDDRVFNAIMEEAANEFTCSIESVSSSEEIDDVQFHKFDLILLDLQLREGSGIELIPELTKHFPNTPIILISAENNISEQNMANLNLHGFVAKSRSPFALITRSLEIMNQIRLAN